MEEVTEMIRRVVIFVLVFQVVLNLFAQSPYIKYFQFFQGIVVIVLLLLPVFSWLEKDGVLEQTLDEKWFQVEMEWNERELEIIGDERDSMLREEMEKRNGVDVDENG